MHHQDRHQDEGDDQRGVDDRRADFERGFEDGVGGRHAVRPFAQTVDDVFDVDDGVVDHDAQRHGQAAQGHGVDAHPQPIHDDNRRQQRQRDADEGDQHGLQVAHESEKNDGDQDSADDQVVENAAQCRFDEVGRAMQVGVDRDALRCHGRPQFVERRLDIACYFQGIGAVLARQADQHAGFPHDNGVAEIGGRRFDHLRDVAYMDDGTGRSTVRRNGRGGDIIDAGGLGIGFDQDALFGGVDKAAPADRRGSLGRLQHVVEAQPTRRQSFGIDANLYAANLTAIDGGAGNAWHGHQAWPQRPLHEIAQGAGRHFRAGEADHEQVHGRRGEGRDLGRPDVGRQGAGGLGQGLGDDLPGAIWLAARFEGDRDDAQALDRFGAHLLDAGRPVDRLFDRARHQLFDLVGGQARRFGLHLGLGGHEVGEDVVIGAHDGDPADE